MSPGDSAWLLALRVQQLNRRIAQVSMSTILASVPSSTMFWPSYPTIGNTRVSVAYYYFYDNIQLYEPLGKALLFTSIS